MAFQSKQRPPTDDIDPNPEDYEEEELPDIRVDNVRGSGQLSSPSSLGAGSGWRRGLDVDAGGRRAGRRERG